MNPKLNNLFIDLDDIAVGEVIILSEEGSRGMREFAASCAPAGCSPSAPFLCSCSKEFESD
ncbi:MAG: hypothetical protein AAGD01_18105 [Acidobacteriota bacterium]